MTNTVPVSLENLALIYDREFSPGLAMTGLVHRELRSSSLDLSFGEQFCGAVSIAHQHSCSIRHQTFGGSPWVHFLKYGLQAQLLHLLEATLGSKLCGWTSNPSIVSQIQFRQTAVHNQISGTVLCTDGVRGLLDASKSETHLACETW